jgi:hypothetical protein
MGTLQKHVMYNRSFTAPYLLYEALTCPIASSVLHTQLSGTSRHIATATVFTSSAVKWEGSRLLLLLCGTICFIKSHELRSVGLSSTRSGSAFSSLMDYSRIQKCLLHRSKFHVPSPKNNGGWGSK